MNLANVLFEIGGWKFIRVIEAESADFAAESAASFVLNTETVDCLYTLDSQSRLCLYWTLMLLSDLTKLAVAVADVDRFC